MQVKHSMEDKHRSLMKFVVFTLFLILIIAFHLQDVARQYTQIPQNKTVFDYSKYALNESIGINVKCPPKVTHKYKLMGTFTRVAIIVSFTTHIGYGRAKKSIDPKHPESLIFFRELLPSFCQTASAGFLYTFYMVYDFSDKLLATNITYTDVFTKTFQRSIGKLCKHITAPNIVYAKGFYEHRISLAQNDGVMMAHRAGNDYFYRINDDAIMETPRWTEEFINALAQFKPPNFGVVGPKHKNGNINIMVFDFTHRLHVDIFGYHYPPYFSNWSQDNWITMIYKPNHSKKLRNVSVIHDISSMGRRYKLTGGDVGVKHHKIVQDLFTEGQRHLKTVLKSCYRDFNVKL